MLLRKWNDKAQTVGIGVAIGLTRVQKRIATATPIPLLIAARHFHASQGESRRMRDFAENNLGVGKQVPTGPGIEATRGTGRRLAADAHFGAPFSCVSAPGALQFAWQCRTVCEQN